MSLEWQVVDIAFRQGLDTKTQKKLVVPGKFQVLENLTLADDYSLMRRDGYVALVASRNGNGLATYNDELLTLHGGYVKTVSTASTPVAANPVSGRTGYVGISKTEVRRTTGMQDTPDCANGGGFTLYAWRDKSPSNAATGISCTLIDESTGAKLINAQSCRVSATAFGVRCVYVNSAFYIFYIDGTSLYCRVVLTAFPTVLGTETALVTSASLAGLNFDACAFGAGSGAMVSYAWADGVTSVRSIEVVQVAGTPGITAGPTNIFTEVQLPVATLTGIAVAKYSTTARAATFVTSTGAAAMAGLAARTLSTAWANVSAATQLDNATAATTSPVHVTACIQDTVLATEGLQVAWDRQSEWSTNALNPLKTVIVDVNLTILGLPAATLINSATFGAGVTARGPKGPFIAGKLFTKGGVVYLPVFVGSVYSGISGATANPRNANTQNSFFVLEFITDPSLALAWTVVGRALYGSYGLASINGNPPAVGTPCSTPEVTSGEFAIAATELTQLVLSNSINVSPSGVVRLTMVPNFSVSPIKTQMGEATYFSGGQLTTYDGASVVEHGFPLFPEGIGVTVNAAGTGALTAGIHQVCVIYEWVDGAGARHQSAPSLPVQFTALGTDSITVNIPTLLLSQKTNIQVVPFMTQANGLTFNRVLLDNSAYVPLMNTVAATQVNFTVDDSDATIAGNEVLYTQPNQAGTTLPNVAPGPIGSLALIHNRLFFSRSDLPTQFGFSQEYVNNVGLQFNPALGGQLPAETGSPTAFAAMDEKVIIFTEDKIFVVFGTGPNPGGGFNNYSEPQDIQSDVGCIEPRSVMADVPGGVLFKSRKGWYLLGRDLSTRYIGDGAAAYDAYDVRSAVLLGDRQEVRFSVVSGTESGVQLVYSYLTDQWSTFRKATTDYVIADAVWWKTTGLYTHISLTAGLNNDTPGLFVDAPGNVTPRAVEIAYVTSWLHLGKLEGFQRVRRWYQSATCDQSTLPLNSTALVSVEFDDSEVGPVPPKRYSFSITFTAATWQAGESIDFRHKLAIMKCKSVRFTFREAADDSGTGQPLTGIQAIALELGLKRGLNKLSAAQTVG